jgi:hypothetical protein
MSTVCYMTVLSVPYMTLANWRFDVIDHKENRI